MSEETIVIDTNKVAGAFDKIFEKDPYAPTASLESAENPKIIPKPEDTKIDPPEEVKPPDTKGEVQDDLPETLPNTGRNETWKKFRGEHQAAKQELASLKTQLSDFEGTRKERDELKGKITDYETQIQTLKEVDSLTRLQNDPDFQAKYDIPRKGICDKLKEQAEYGDIDPKELINVLGKSGKEKIQALEDIISTAPSIVKGKIVALIDQLDTIDTERASELTNASHNLEKRTKDREASNKKQREDYEKNALETFSRKSESLEKELGIPKEIIDKAREFFTKNHDLDKATEIIIKGMYADHLKVTGADSQKKIADLEKELAEYRNANPSIRSGSPLSPTSPDKDLGYVEAIQKAVRESRILG